MNTLWGTQKEIMESVGLKTGILLTYLESDTELLMMNMTNYENSLRADFTRLLSRYH